MVARPSPGGPGKRWDGWDEDCRPVARGTVHGFVPDDVPRARGTLTLRSTVRTYLTGLAVVWFMVASACAMGVDEESAMPPKPPRLDGSTGATGGESGSGGSGSSGWTPAGGEAGAAGIPASAGFGATGGATGGAAGEPPAAGFGGGGSGGGGVDCNPGEVQDLGDCGMCGSLQKVCNGSGSWDTPSCIDQGVCTPNDVEEASCGNCGTQTRTCSNTCVWGSYGTCQSQGCAPGDTQDCMCSTLGSTTSCCGQKVCNNNCEWGTCGLKPTSQCDWDAGTTYRCCGSGGSWEWCLSSCQWSGNCASCGGCGC
jgi:hypothetical protein